MILIPKKYLRNQSCFFCHAHNTEDNTPVKYMMHITYPKGTLVLQPDGSTEEGYRCEWHPRPTICICRNCLQNFIKSKISIS